MYLSSGLGDLPQLGALACSRMPSFASQNLCSDHAWVPVRNAFTIGFFSFFSLLLLFTARLYLSKIQALKPFFPHYLCFLMMSLPSASNNTASQG